MQTLLLIVLIAVGLLVGWVVCDLLNGLYMDWRENKQNKAFWDAIDGKNRRGK